MMRQSHVNRLCCLLATLLLTTTLGWAAQPAPDATVPYKPKVLKSTPEVKGSTTAESKTLPKVAGEMTDETADEQVNWQVLAGGGGIMTAPGYRIGGTLGQTAVGISTASTVIAHHGFWQDFAPSEEPCCGRYTDGFTGNTDCSTDGSLKLSDITILIDHVYISYKPLCCHENGNVNGSLDGAITLNDITRLIDRIYLNYTPTAPCP